MNLKNILPIAHCSCGVDVTSKKSALDALSQLVCDNIAGFDKKFVLKKFIDREKLGSTGLAKGIAIPHARISGIEAPQGFLLKLKQGIDFQAADGEPVIILFGLLVPEDDPESHLLWLAHLTTLFTDKELRDRLCQIDSKQELYHQIINASEAID